MRKLAMLSVGAAFAAGVVLVPAGAAGAATTHAAGATVTQVHPRISLYHCVVTGGHVQVIEPGYGICIGGPYDGAPVWW